MKSVLHFRWSLGVLRGALVFLCFPGWAESPGVRPSAEIRSFPIPRAAIVAALEKLSPRYSGNELGHARIDWPKNVASHEKNPALAARRAQWDIRQRSWQITLGCTEHSACKDFIVHVGGMGKSTRPLALVNPPRPGRRGAWASPIVNRGETATLVVDQPAIRIQIRVVCLEPGVFGQSIRVLDTLSRRVLNAEVTGPGILRAL